jgi:hypothetical protein
MPLLKIEEQTKVFSLIIVFHWVHCQYQIDRLQIRFSVCENKIILKLRFAGGCDHEGAILET